MSTGCQRSAAATTAPTCFDAFVRSQGFVLLDGGLATELEARGHDLNDPLWSAKVLIDDPAAVEAVHLAYLRAGADCVITATYQASHGGLAARGVGRAEADRIMRLAVELATRARDRFWNAPGMAADGERLGPAADGKRLGPAADGERLGPPGEDGERAEPTVADRRRLRPLVAASVGPYGACLADGSEYRGDYAISRAALADFHRDRLKLLAGTSADLLACETMPSLAEARVLASLVADLTDKPAWFAFTCRSARELSDGTPLDEVADWARGADGVHAVGVNCTPAALVPEVVGVFARRVPKPVVAYPNGGGAWDAATKTWGSADAAPDWGGAAREWIAAGATAVGGCCRVGAGAVRAMRAGLGSSHDRPLRLP